MGKRDVILEGETVSVIETQYYCFISEDLIIDTTTKVEGSMSESFGTSAKWIVSPKGDKELICKIIVQNEYKGTWFKATVEDFIHSSSVSAFEKYKELITGQIEQLVRKRMAQAPSEPNKAITLIKNQKKNLLSDSETDEEYFDTEGEFVQQSPEISKFLQNITQELSNLRETIESNETRLLAIEAAFLNLQEKFIPSVNTKSKSFHENLIQYFKRVDDLSAQLECEKKGREEERILGKKMDQLGKKMTNSSKTWAVAILFLFVAWPVFANQALKFAKSVWMNFKS